MLQAHSYLWHYLWVAPNVLLLILAVLLWWRGAAHRFPVFLAFIVIGALGQLVVYCADLLPLISAEVFWRIAWANLILEGILKFAVIGEIFAQVLGSYSSLARLGKILIRIVGVVLVFAAALAAALTPTDNSHVIVAGDHLLSQTIYLVETGLLGFIFLFAAYFGLRMKHAYFGMSLGLSVSACVHLAAWALIANGDVPDSNRIILTFLNMAAYHFCVLLWFYYLLVPEKVAAQSAVPVPENNLAVWNRELERLLQQ